MAKRIIEQQDNFILYTTFIGEDQAYITASVKNGKTDQISTGQAIYEKIIGFLYDTGMKVIQERIFGNISLHALVLAERDRIREECKINDPSPVTYIQGQPCWGEGLAGIQIRAFHPEKAGENVWTIYDGDEPSGRGWKRDGGTFLLLQNMNGFSEDQKNDRREQTKRMFDRTLKLLRKEGASFKNVVRTWIYLSDILEWYGDFNVERNAKFQEFGLLHNDSDEKSQAENIYLPASTGIFGYNPLGAANAMDVLAVIPQNENAMIIEPTSGLKQKSPYRYGSAFSRAMNVKESDVTYILLSGTAAIDDQGNSLYPGDTCAQIKKTFEIVEALISKEGATLDDICKATVFLKRSEDHSIYLKTVSELGLENLPAVCVVADVCRDDLLFELDAGVALVKS